MIVYKASIFIQMTIFFCDAQLEAKLSVTFSKIDVKFFLVSKKFAHPWSNVIWCKLNLKSILTYQKSWIYLL